MSAAQREAEVLRADGLRLSYGDRRVLDGLTTAIVGGTAVALVGPNGSGKSTLLKALARLLRPQAGTVLLDGVDIARSPTAAVARRLATLPQSPATPAGITVRELVEQGRFPHRGPFRGLTRADRGAVDEALRLTGMETFADRMLDQLSGGERQRAWIALTLAQETGILLLDEPTTFLDVGHQLEVLELVDRLRVERALSVVLVLHDLNQAARHADRMVALLDGRIVADGPPAQVLTARLCADVFGANATVITDPATGSPVCLPYASARRPAGPAPAQVAGGPVRG